MRPVVTPAGGAPGSAHSTSRARPSGAAPAPTRGRARTGVTVRQLDRGADDGYHSGLVPGLKSSSDAQRLASELAFAAQRLATLAATPPGLYARVADPALGLEERSWLAFQIAYIGPLDGPDPFASLEAAVTTWSSGEAPALDQVQLGPRSSHEAGRGTRTIDAYRAWVARAGSQEAAFTGAAAWTPERRFARVFERLSLPGLTRGARFDLLVTLGALGVYQLSAGLLAFGGADEGDDRGQAPARDRRHDAAGAARGRPGGRLRARARGARRRLLQLGAGRARDARRRGAGATRSGGARKVADVLGL